MSLTFYMYMFNNITLGNGGCLILQLKNLDKGHRTMKIVMYLMELFENTIVAIIGIEKRDVAKKFR